MNKNLIALAILVVGLVGITIFWVSSHEKSTPLQKEAIGSTPLSVIASFYPLANFAENVGGDQVSVISVTPAGAEPHDYEPTPQDLVRIQEADVFIYNGNGLDGWAEKIAPELKSKGVTVVKMSDSLQSLPGGEHEHEEEDHEGEEHEEESNHLAEDEEHSFDPHFWLDPINAKTEVKTIAEALRTADPKNALVYNENEKNYLAKLENLDQEYQTGLTTCQTRKIVTSHNAFSYLAKRYNLENRYISGLSPEEEPTPKRMAEIAEEAKKENIRYIFFETLVSPNLSNTIAREIGAQTLVLNPIEGLSEEEIASGKDYIGEMRNNLANLKTALSCQ